MLDPSSRQSLPLPSLLVYESIDLMGSNRTPLSDGPVQLMSDPEYSDLVYAQHNLGTHTISLRPIRDLLTQGTSLTTTGLSTMVNTDTTSDVSWLLREGLERSEEPFLRDAVVGMAIVNDVYLGYVAIFLHANLHVTCIELALRSERPADLQHDTFAEDTSITALNITNTNAPPAYKAFAGAADFVLPDLLVNNSTSRKVSTRYASQAPSSSQSNRATRDARPTLDLTIESLRFVGETIESLDKNIRDLITAANAVQDRLGEQLEEIPRQVDKISQLEGSLESKTQDLDTTFVNRLEEVKRKQQAITSRADSILQRLIDSSQPELSVYEKAWIEELGRVQQAVGSLTDRKSLESRTERLKEQLDVLRPRLEEMARIKGAKNSFAERGRLGEAQRLRVEGTLAEESRLISEARQRIDRLQKKIVLATKSTLQTVV